MCALPDYLKCSMNDVIAASARLHPSLLRAKMLAAETTHRRFADATPDTAAAHAGYKMAEAAARIATILEHDAGAMVAPAYVANFTLNARILAFSAAADLLCIPRSLRGDIAARG